MTERGVEKSSGEVLDEIVNRDGEVTPTRMGVAGHCRYNSFGFQLRHSRIRVRVVLNCVD